ncbi:hypothetical protein YC2023_083527 [Brassica napus]
MASYVFNNNYLKNGLADEACSFNNTAPLTSINPSNKRVSNGRVVDDNFNGCRTSRYESWLTGFQQLYLVGLFTNSEPRRGQLKHTLRGGGGQWVERNGRVIFHSCCEFIKGNFIPRKVLVILRGICHACVLSYDEITRPTFLVLRGIYQIRGFRVTTNLQGKHYNGCTRKALQ